MMYQRWGDNRSYKTAFNAWEAYKAYKRGMTVYCNCPKRNGIYNHILNFPHEHLSPFDPDFGQKEVYNCCIITDQTESAGLDSRTSNAVRTKEAGYFAGQAKKAGVEWWYDSLRHKRLDITVRQFSDWYIHHIRYPPLMKVWYDKDGKYHDWPPAQYVKLGVIHRDSTGSPKWWTYYRPFLEKLHKLYNTEVQIRPSNQTSESLNIPLLHKALVAP
jgi:hypothetical protein